MTTPASKRDLRPGLWAGEDRAGHRARGNACLFLEESCPSLWVWSVAALGTCPQPSFLCLHRPFWKRSLPSVPEWPQPLLFPLPPLLTSPLNTSPGEGRPGAGPRALEGGPPNWGGNSLRKRVGVAPKVGGSSAWRQDLTKGGPTSSLRELTCSFQSGPCVAGTEGWRNTPSSWVRFSDPHLGPKPKSTWKADGQ